MDINKLKAFVAVCNTGSYTKVAKSFGYTHAGISYMIKSLEDEVGFSLLEKKGTSRIPTANARKILPDILKFWIPWNGWSIPSRWGAAAWRRD